MTGRFRPRFNFEAEVEAAEDRQKEMLIKLGIEKPRSSPRRPGRPKRDRSKKDNEKAPDLPIPRKLPSIPAPILPF